MGRERYRQTAAQAVRGEVAVTVYDTLDRPTISALATLPDGGLPDGGLSLFVDAPTLPQGSTVQQAVLNLYGTGIEVVESWADAGIGIADVSNVRGRPFISMAWQRFTPGDLASDATAIFGYSPAGQVTHYAATHKGLGTKAVTYSYDPVDGKLLAKRYQHGQPDSFTQRFEYDADGRLVLAASSNDEVLWERDARYSYYAHGPLARTVLGEDEVQGVDRVYTVQGWLKSINSSTGEPSGDPGRDAEDGGARWTARDVFGLTLGYFPGDFSAADTSFVPTWSAPDAGLLVEAPGLFDGTIRHRASINRGLPGLEAEQRGATYQYDQLGRLTASGIRIANRASTSPPALEVHGSQYTYDHVGEPTRVAPLAAAQGPPEWE